MWKWVSGTTIVRDYNKVFKKQQKKLLYLGPGILLRIREIEAYTLFAQQ